MIHVKTNISWLTNGTKVSNFIISCSAISNLIDSKRKYKKLLSNLAKISEFAIPAHIVKMRKFILQLREQRNEIREFVKFAVFQDNDRGLNSKLMLIERLDHINMALIVTWQQFNYEMRDFIESIYGEQLRHTPYMMGRNTEAEPTIYNGIVDYE